MSVVHIHKEFLKDLTDLTLLHGLIIAESIHSKELTYDPLSGYKLFWDSDLQTYVCANPDGSITNPKE
jgi:hypothetical protein